MDKLLTKINNRTEDKKCSPVVGFIEEEEKSYKVLGDKNISKEILFEVGSITKVYTALLLVLLSIRGVVSYETTVSQIIDDVEFEDEKIANITLKELALHTSGLPRLPDNIDPKDPSDPYAGYKENDLLRFLASHKLDRSKKGTVQYSNIGFGLLSYLLAEESGKSYEDLLKENIFNPLDLNNTYLNYSESKSNKLIKGYNKEGEKASRWHSDILAGAGGLISNAPDLLKFLSVQLKSKLHKNFSSAIKETHIPRVKRQKENSQQALGWIIRSVKKDRKIYWHNGETGGYKSFFGVRPDEKRGIVVLINCKIEIEDLAFDYLK